MPNAIRRCAVRTIAIRLGIALLCTSSIPVSAQGIPAPAPPVPQRISASKIVLVGDSTTAVAGGWGGVFCGEHVTSFVACVNLARGGRSSGSYIAEGSWEIALAEMKTPGFARTWVLIQFGHNDQPGKPGRSTDLATEFPANIARYVRETRAAGAMPILVTPLTRRMFANGAVERSGTLGRGSAQGRGDDEGAADRTECEKRRRGTGDGRGAGRPIRAAAARRGRHGRAGRHR